MGYIASGSAVESALATNALRTGIFKGGNPAIVKSVPGDAAHADIDYFVFEVDLTDFTTIHMKAAGYGTSYKTYLKIGTTKVAQWYSAADTDIDVSSYTGKQTLHVGMTQWDTAQNSTVYHLWGE